MELSRDLTISLAHRACLSRELRTQRSTKKTLWAAGWAGGHSQGWPIICHFKSPFSEARGLRGRFWSACGRRIDQGAERREFGGSKDMTTLGGAIVERHGARTLLPSSSSPGSTNGSSPSSTSRRSLAPSMPPGESRFWLLGSLWSTRDMSRERGSGLHDIL